jgi:Tol biopolymer transport system component
MLLVSACSDTGGPSSVPDADIAFVRDTDIYTTSLDAGAVPHLIAKDLTAPSWSPDGKLLVALKPTDPQALFLMNADGKNLHQLTRLDWSQVDLSDPAWKPDGQVITFSTRCHSGGNCRLYTNVWQIPLDGSDETILANLYYIDPQWSPDGARYTLQLVDLIFIQNSDGTNRFGLAQGCCVDWSPDGATIAYGNDGRIHLVEPAGINDRTLPFRPDSAYASVPKWSPDGTRIAFVTYSILDTFPRQVPYVMNADGSGVIELGPDIQVNSSVDWSHDGQFLGFSGFASQADVDANLSQLYIVRPDGTDLHPITEKGAICCFGWRPN